MDFGKLAQNFQSLKDLVGPALIRALETHGPRLLDTLLSDGQELLARHSDAEILPGLSAEKLLELLLGRLQPTFPGLSMDAVRKGEIPIATSLLEAELQKWAAGQEGLESLAITSEPDRFRLTLNTQKLMLRHRITLHLGVEAFEFSQASKTAHFHCQGDPEVEGANFLGSLSVALASATIRKALQSQDRQHSIRLESGCAVDLQWPDATVDLGMVEALKAVTDFQVFGKGLLDLLTFGPLRIESDRVVLQTGIAWPKKP